VTEETVEAKVVSTSLSTHMYVKVQKGVVRGKRRSRKDVNNLGKGCERV
jgi:hypothetical protein